MWRRLSHFALVYESIKSNCASQTHPKIWIRRACKRLEASWMNSNTILQNLKQRWRRVWLTTQLFCKNLVCSFRPVQYNILNVLILLVATVGENQQLSHSRSFSSGEFSHRLAELETAIMQGKVDNSNTSQYTGA